MNIVLAVLLALSIGCTKKSSAPSADDKIKKIQEAIATAPSYENYIGLGLELSAAGRSNEALEAYKKAININPKAPIGWNNVCAELNAQKRFTEAISNCRRAVELEPKFVLAQNNLKYSLEQSEKTRETLREKHKAALANPKLDSATIINIGMEFYSANDLNSAVDVWKRIKAGDKLYAMAQSNLASSYILMNKLDLAEKALAIALKLEPENQIFKNNKAWLEGVKKK